MRFHDVQKFSEPVPGESPDEFRLFCYFRDVGADKYRGLHGRTCEAVARFFGIPQEIPEDLRKRFDWDIRAQAYDDFLDDRLLERTEEQAREMAQRHLRLSTRMQKLASVELEKQLDLSARSGMTSLSVRDIVRLTRTGIEAEKLARKELEETENAQETFDFSKLNEEELETLHKLMERARG